MSTITATASDADVFRAFAFGDALAGDTTRSETWFGGRTQYRSVSALFSHGVPLALRSEECVVFDAAPCGDGGRCTCAYVKHASQAHEAVREVFGEDEVSRLDHGAFVGLAGRLGAITR